MNLMFSSSLTFRRFICSVIIGQGLLSVLSCSVPNKVETNSNAQSNTSSSSAIQNQKPQPSVTPFPKRDFKHSAKITTHYDKFKDLTLVNLDYSKNLIKVDQHTYITLKAAFTYHGQNSADRTMFVLLYIGSLSKDWKFENNRELIVLADGQRLKLGEMEMDESKITDDYIIPNAKKEFGHIAITTQEFFAIAGAQDVEMQAGLAEFTVSEDILEGFRDLASRMNP